jgi:hypothetical protein
LHPQLEKIRSEVHVSVKSVTNFLCHKRIS